MTPIMPGREQEVVCAVLRGESTKRAAAGTREDATTASPAVDDDDAPAVTAGAARLARRLDARLRIVHVLERALSRAPPEQVAASGPSAEGRDESGRLFARCRAALPAEAGADFVTVEGDAAERLRAVAREVDAGLIAVGRAHHGAVGAALLGSVMHQLLRTGTTQCA